MGQKVNPKGIRLGISTTWDASWYAESDRYSSLLIEDYKIRVYIRREMFRAGVSNIQINRKSDFTEVQVTLSRPGVIFGKNNGDTSLFLNQIKKIINKTDVNLKIVEEKQADLSAKLVAEWICAQLERRMPFRRVMKMAIQRVLKAGADGVRVACAGRLGGAEIARTEWYIEGRVPLHTFRSMIDYDFSEALTTFGKIGVKVWINKGEVHVKQGVNSNVNA